MSRGYDKGRHEIGYQSPAGPDGYGGWSNAGLDAHDAIADIELGSYSHWSDAERIAVNVESLYREFRNDTQHTNIIELFTLMSESAGYR